jgi:tetratricopeptide (TPR) repeat protein
MKKAIGISIVVGIGLGSLLWWKIQADARREFLRGLQVSYNSGDLNDVIARADQALVQRGDDVDAMLAAATAYAMKGSVGFAEGSNGAKAIEYADRVLQIDPENSEAYRVKAYALEIQERYDDAHANYDKAIIYNPNNFQALSNKGHAYDLQGKLDDAERLYKSSLEVNPTGEHALLNISRLYIRRAKFPEAKQSLKTLSDTTANLRFKAEAYQMLAEILRNEMDYAGAAEAIERSTELDPGVPQAWVTRGHVRLMGMLEADDASRTVVVTDVETYANKALAINPNQASAYTLLFDLMGALGQPERKETYKQQALAAVERDITLGQQERQALREYLLAEVVVEDVPQSQPSGSPSDEVRLQ